MTERAPVLALTQGDPAGVGPQILLRCLAAGQQGWRPLLVAERVALESVRELVPEAEELWPRLRYVGADLGRSGLEAMAPEEIAVLDPIGARRVVTPGEPRPEDAGGALAALDAGIELALGGAVEALITAPVSKLSIARHCLADFRGHTDYLARRCGLERYGRDYLMAFLAPSLRVALLTTHLPLSEAVAAVSETRVLEALRCLSRHVDGSIALAGLNPHAGEGGLLGDEERTSLAPAIERARQEGIAVHGPESPDTVFARARAGEFDWVLALYHDQGLIAVKTLGFGTATNWTMGLPFLRTSVDHGTAFDVARAGRADAAALRHVVATTLDLVSRAAG